jgi:teichuronic acid biosynthesis glycosyltransferase TuaH
MWQPGYMRVAVVALLSLEPWDEVWRRNQHLASQLVRQRLVEELIFVEPAARGTGRTFSPEPGLRVVRPRLPVPRRLGGLGLLGLRLKRSLLRDADLLWVNDAPLGVHCLDRARPAIYDVTDDWRSSDLPSRILRRLVRAEDALTRGGQVVVCSEVLQGRWLDRYGVTPPVVQNGADVEAYLRAAPRHLRGASPHVGYVGTLHGERLDLDLVLALARDPRIGTVHLVGPDCLTDRERDRLAAEPSITLDGAVAASEVPQWLLSLDVLICPHLVTAFTLSLDGIKAHEYLASGRPIVATATSGFQLLAGEPGVWIVQPTQFADAVAAAVGKGVEPGGRGVSWAERAEEFAAVLGNAR